MKELILIIACFTYGSGMCQCDISFAQFNPLCAGICAGQINATPSGTAPFTYNWSTGDTTAIVDSLCAGTYTLTITDDLSCIHTDSTIIMEPDTFIVDAYLISNASDVGECDGQIGWTTQGGVPDYTIYWKDCNTQQYYWGFPGFCAGDYYCIFTDSNGCIDSSNCVTIDVFSGLKVLNTNDFIYYPNPVTDKLNLVIHNAKNAVFQIYSVSGQLIKSGTTQNSQIDISDIASGQYILRVLVEQSTYSMRMTKE
ncbi:MAG: T9SS type A sorting domain-containing protein [Crocinitomicaceae bacterium]